MHNSVLNLEAAYLEEPERRQDKKRDEAAHDRVLDCDIIVDLVLLDVALQMHCCDEHADVGDYSLE